MSPLLGDVPDKQFIDVGHQQLVKVAKAVETVSSEKKPQMEYTLEDAAGRTIRIWFSLSVTALWKFKTFVAACGIPADKLKLFNTDEPRHHAALIGRQLYIDVVPPQASRKYPDIARWYSLAGKTMQAVQHAAQEEIVNRLAPTPEEEDQVPF